MAQEMMVDAGARCPVKVLFTPVRPGWESGKLVIKIKDDKGPTLKTSIGLHGFGGCPEMVCTRNGQPLERDIHQLGLLRPDEPFVAFKISNNGDAYGFASVRLFEDPYLQRPVDEVTIEPDKLVLAPGQVQSLILKVDPTRAGTGHRSAFVVVYVGAEMGRQVNI